MTNSTHSYEPDPRNAAVLININGELIARDKATVSVFDSGFLLGDGVWEGLRLHDGKLVFLDRHLARLYDGAKAYDFHPGLSPAELTAELYRTVAANKMTDDVHIRLIVTRGIRSTPYQDPRVIISQPTVVMIPEFKKVRPEVATRGIRVGSVPIRRGPSDVQDPTLNTLSKLNCISACILATHAGYDEALMLDPQGFVATCNSTHFFMVRNGTVYTSSGDYCLDGITRGVVIELCAANDIPCRQTNFTLAQVYAADEAFVTGTFAGVSPVSEVDGRQLSSGRGPLVERLQELYAERLAVEVAASE